MVGASVLVGGEGEGVENSCKMGRQPAYVHYIAGGGGGGGGCAHTYVHFQQNASNFYCHGVHN